MARLLVKDRVTTSVGVVLSILVLQKIISFGRGIIFARLLGTEQYGIYSLSLFMIFLMVTISSLGIHSTFSRYIPLYETVGRVRCFLKRTYTLNILSSFAASLLIFIRRTDISRLIYGSEEHGLVIAVAACSIPLMVTVKNVSGSFTGLKLFRASSVCDLTQMSLYAAIGIGTVLIWGNAVSVLGAFAVSILATVVVFSVLLRRYLIQMEPTYKPIDENFYGRILRFSIWFIAAPILVQLFHYVDRLSLQHLMSASDQGVYSATVNLSESIAAIGVATSNVVLPHLSHQWETGRREEALSNLDLAIRVTGVCLLVIGSLLVAAGPMIIGWLLGTSYLPGAPALPYLVIFHLFTISVWLFGTYPSLIEKTYISSIGLACALPVNVALNLVLIPRVGIRGAAIATMLSYLVMWTIVLVLCRKFGLKIRLATLVISLTPLLLALPLPAGLGAVAVVSIASFLGTSVFSRTEKEKAKVEILSFLRRRD